jgi:hypothetical protein
MTTEMSIDQIDMGEAIASFVMDDGDIAVERLVSPGQASANPFFVTDQVMENGTSQWMEAISLGSMPFHDQTFELLDHHTDVTHFALEDIQVSDLDLSVLPN